MSHVLAKYNVHKRATLDRLTLLYQLQIRSVYRNESSHVMPRMIDSLNVGHHNFNPDVPGSKLDHNLKTVFTNFQNAVIKAGFSDGLQEVTPEGRLNRWLDYPLSMPVENTIILGGHALADKRDKLVDDYKDEKERTLADKIRLYVSGSKNSYLENIRKAYGKAAKKWIKGKTDTDVVRDLLKRSLHITDGDAERVLRTETTNYFAETRADYFERHTDVDYLQFYAITDGRISDICNDRHGFCFPIGRAKDADLCPACHPNCRSVQRPLFSFISSNQRLIEKYDSKSIAGLTESQWTDLPAGWT